MTPPAESLAGNSALILLARVVGNAGLLASVVVLAWGLPPSGRGAVAFLITTSMVVAFVASLGAGPATLIFAVRSAARQPQLLANLVISTCAGTLGLSVVVVAGLQALESVRPPSLADVDLMLLAAAAMLTAFNEASYYFLQACGRLRQWAVTVMCVPWIYSGWLLGLWVTVGLSVTSAAAAYVAQQALRTVWTLGLSVRAVGLARPSLHLWRETRSFGLRAWVGALSGFLAFRADVIVMGLISTEAALGLYAVAVNVAEIALLIPMAVATALPALIASGDPAVGAERVLRALRGLTIVTLATVAVAALLCPFLLPLAFGTQYADSVPPLLWLLPGTLGLAVIMVVSNALLGSSSPGRGSIGPFVALVVGLALDFVLIPPYGASGAAIASSVAYCAGAITSLVLYRRIADFRLAALVPRPADARELVTTAARLFARITRRPAVGAQQ